MHDQALDMVSMLLPFLRSTYGKEVDRWFSITARTRADCTAYDPSSKTVTSTEAASLKATLEEDVWEMSDAFSAHQTSSSAERPMAFSGAKEAMAATIPSPNKHDARSAITIKTFGPDHYFTEPTAESTVVLDEVPTIPDDKDTRDQFQGSTVAKTTESTRIQLRVAKERHQERDIQDEARDKEMQERDIKDEAKDKEMQKLKDQLAKLLAGSAAPNSPTVEHPIQEETAPETPSKAVEEDADHIQTSMEISVISTLNEDNSTQQHDARSETGSNFSMTTGDQTSAQSSAKRSNQEDFSNQSSDKRSKTEDVRDKGNNASEAQAKGKKPNSPLFHQAPRPTIKFDPGIANSDVGPGS